MDWTVIGVKKDTHKRFKKAAKGQYHDYFVNILLELYEACAPVERAEIMARHPRQQRQEVLEGDLARDRANRAAANREAEAAE